MPIYAEFLSGACSRKVFIVFWFLAGVCSELPAYAGFLCVLAFRFWILDLEARHVYNVLLIWSLRCVCSHKASVYSGF